MEDGTGMGKGKLTMEVERQLRGVKIGFSLEMNRDDKGLQGFPVQMPIFVELYKAGKAVLACLRLGVAIQKQVALVPSYYCFA